MNNDKKSLKHIGVLGMRWGRRMGPTGVVTTTVRGQRVPMKTMVKGQPVVVNAKAASNSIKERVAKALGMRKAPETKAIIDEADRILNDPKSSKDQLDKALKSIGIDPKSGKRVRTEPVYDKDGNDVSVNPFARVFKKNGQSDKEFDAELKGEESAQSIAKQKVADIREDQVHKAMTVGMLATVGAITVAKYVALKQIEKAANASILEKYGPTVGQMFINSR